MSQAEEATQQTDDNPMHQKAAYAMFGLLLFTYILMVADRFLVSMLAVDIRGALDLSVPNMFALTTMFTLGLGIGGLPAAALIARYSRKAVLLTGLVLLSGATLLFTQATGFWHHVRVYCRAGRWHVFPGDGDVLAVNQLFRQEPSSSVGYGQP